MRRWWVRPWLWAVAAVLLALVLVSPHVGRAEPTGNYRPPLPAAALSTGCYPLPAGLSLDFPYQVRTDGDVGPRRRLVVQYDEVDRATVVRRLDAALARAGLPADSATVTAAHPGAVKAWSSNSAVVDTATKSILAGSEDGVLYRWDLGTNTFTQKIRITNGLGEAYTPTALGPDGTVFAIGNARLFAIVR